MLGYKNLHLDFVVKVGGSLFGDLASLRMLIREMEFAVAKGMRLLVIPGGGVPDKAIEKIDSEVKFSLYTAHFACALAQDQTGLMLCDRTFSQKFRACRTFVEVGNALASSEIPVLLPSHIIEAMDPFEMTWDITSDGIAGWFAWVTSTDKLIVITNVDGIFTDGRVAEEDFRISDISALELIRMGHTSVDRCLAGLLHEKAITGFVINGLREGEFTRCLNSEVGNFTKISCV
ncbi:amino acid kinase family protein [Paraburkholderia tropica]|uniref:amino acid kinase family protein n=1 Tax=Paraburkholderia tropica TaxID=92647 RepID=UPI002AB7B2B1|nr:hypothetical protein [Paraburkholderia tropica]